MRRTRTLALVAALAIVAVAGCGGGTKPIERAAEPVAETTIEPTTSASTTASTAPQSDEEAVLAAYHAYWDTWLAANDPPNPDHPGLEQYYTGSAQETAIREIQKNRDLGMALRLPPSSRFGFTIESIQVGGQEANVVVCLVDDGLVVDAATGRVLNDRVSSSRIEAKLVKGGDGWAVSDNRYVQKYPGSDGCQR